MTELRRDMPAAELNEWIAYNNTEPLPDVNYSGAQICQTVANVNRPTGKRPYKVSDFAPKAHRQRRRRSAGDTPQIDPEQVVALFKGMS